MNNVSFFCMAMIYVYETCLNKYKSWPESDRKLDFKEQFSWWLYCLEVLAHVDDSVDIGGKWKREFDKIEPSELSFLTDIRFKSFITSLTIKEEFLVYITLNKLYCK